MRYKYFEDLPKGFKRRIADLHPRDFEKWVKLSVPALQNKSVVETLTEEDGYRKVAQYLGKVEGFVE